MTSMLASGSWLQGYALLLVLATIGVVIHECGHVVGCLLTARQVVSVQIGTGPLVFRLRIAGVPTTVRCTPFSGLVRYTFQHPVGPIPARKAKRVLLASAIVTAGGPIGNVLMIVLIQQAALHGLRHDIAAIGIVNQVLVLLWNLYPREVAVDRDGRMIVIANDGKKLVSYYRSWALMRQHPDKSFSLTGGPTWGSSIETGIGNTRLNVGKPLRNDHSHPGSLSS